MRKIILVVILALSIFLCYTTVVNGANIGETLSIPNFEKVEIASKSVDTLISQLVNLNDIEYKNKQKNLETAKKSYNDAKEEYEEMASVLQTVEEDVDISMVDIYDVDFLWTVIGNYGTEEGISLKFDVTRSAMSSLMSSDYQMCDLKFTISGDYIALTEFIYDIEDDSKLGFEISNFEMAKGGDNLQATFTVKNVPINSTNLTELQTSIETNTTVDEYGNTVNTNTTTTSTVDSSTTNNTVENTTTSSTNTVN